MLTSFSNKKKKKNQQAPSGSRYENARPNHGAPLRAPWFVKSLRPGSAGSHAASLFIHASLQLITHRSRCDRTCIKVFLKIPLLFFHMAFYGEQRRGGCAEDVLKANQPIWCHLSPLQKQTNKQKRLPKKGKVSMLNLFYCTVLWYENVGIQLSHKGKWCSSLTAAATLNITLCFQSFTYFLTIEKSTTKSGINLELANSQ